MEVSIPNALSIQQSEYGLLDHAFAAHRCEYYSGMGELLRIVDTMISDYFCVVGDFSLVKNSYLCFLNDEDWRT